MALLWAAGIIWFAYDFAAPSDEAANTDGNQVADHRRQRRTGLA